MFRKPKYSFEQWCIDASREDLLDRWDYDKNELPPSDVAYKSEKTIWFKCPDGRHESEPHRIDNLANGRNKTIYCEKCRSFAQHIIDKYDEERLSKIWSDKNSKSPWEYSYGCSAKVYFNCLDNSNHTFKREIISYMNQTDKCPICADEQRIRETSLACVYPKSLLYWSDLNEKTPYDYSSQVGVSLYWKCHTGTHEDFKKSIRRMEVNDFMCPKCTATVKGCSASNIIDLTGQKFGELTVIGFVPKEELELDVDNTRAYWRCSCSCGNEIIANGQLLRNGHTRTCGDKQKHYGGESNPNWKGGITPENISARNNDEYKKWRNDVYAKDYYTCQCCGKSNWLLNAHHLKDFATYEDLRYDVANGITLCLECHHVQYEDSFHSEYGCVGTTELQLEEYINNRRKELGIPIPFNIDDYKDGNRLNKDSIKEIEEFYKVWNFVPYLAGGIRPVKNDNGFTKIKPKFRIKED